MPKPRPSRTRRTGNRTSGGGSGHKKHSPRRGKSPAPTQRGARRPECPAGDDAATVVDLATADAAGNVLDADTPDMPLGTQGSGRGGPSTREKAAPLPDQDGAAGTGERRGDLAMVELPAKPQVLPAAAPPGVVYALDVGREVARFAMKSNKHMGFTFFAAVVLCVLVAYLSAALSAHYLAAALMCTIGVLTQEVRSETRSLRELKAIMNCLQILVAIAVVNNMVMKKISGGTLTTVVGPLFEQLGGPAGDVGGQQQHGMVRLLDGLDTP